MRLPRYETVMLISRALQKLNWLPKAEEPRPPDPVAPQHGSPDPIAFLDYERRRASDQNGVDLVSGWLSDLPIDGVVSGPHDLFNDGRIGWITEQVGSVAGMSILELGPLDGGHTYQLDKLGAGSVLAIEASKKAFVRCLLSKNLLGMPSAKFMLGDFREWLATTTDHYDLIVASGVLYHMPDPIDLLEQIAAKTDRLYLWTHHFSDAEMPEGDMRRGAFIGEPHAVQWRGLSLRLWRRQYHMPAITDDFCGGLDNDHVWMDGGDIVKVLAALGFSDIRVAHANPDGPNGPSRSFFASR